MKTVGFDSIQNLVSFKMVLNETAVIFLRTEDQHRDFKTDGVSYEDDYKGNALAAVVTRTGIDNVDIRFHSAFTDERVRNLVAGLLSKPEMGFLKGAAVYYQGRLLVCGAIKRLT